MLLGHRYYDSTTGRFISRDPMGDGQNWYTYCENNPLINVDPMGLGIGDIFHTALDIIGVVDPFGVADGLNALSYLIEGDYTNAGISAAGLIPFVGDAAKVGKYSNKAAKAVDGLTTAERARIGNVAHADFDEFAKGKGWDTGTDAYIKNKNTKKIIAKPDAQKRSGQPVELKPNSKSGRKKGRAQAKKYEKLTGKPCERWEYDPESYMEHRYFQLMK